MPPDLDTRIWWAALAHVRQLEQAGGGVLTGRELQQGFEFGGNASHCMPDTASSNRGR